MSSLASGYDCMSDRSDNSTATVLIPGAGVFARERDKENHATGEINSWDSRKCVPWSPDDASISFILTAMHRFCLGRRDGQFTRLWLGIHGWSGIVLRIWRSRDSQARVKVVF